jgi:hypothetical protein
MSDHGLGLGAVVTFEVVDARRLVVGIHRRSALTEQHSFQQPVTSAALAGDSTASPEADNNSPDHSTHPGGHEVRVDARPHFRKTLRRTHANKCASSRLVSNFSSPFSFWQHVYVFRDFLYPEFNAGLFVKPESFKG